MHIINTIIACVSQIVPAVSWKSLLHHMRHRTISNIRCFSDDVGVVTAASGVAMIHVATNNETPKFEYAAGGGQSNAEHEYDAAQQHAHTNMHTHASHPQHTFCRHAKTSQLMDEFYGRFVPLHAPFDGVSFDFISP